MLLIGLEPITFPFESGLYALAVGARNVPDRKNNGNEPLQIVISNFVQVSKAVLWCIGPFGRYAKRLYALVVRARNYDLKYS